VTFTVFAPLPSIVADMGTDRTGESGLDGTSLLPNPIRRPLTRCNAIVDMSSALLACPPNTAWLVAIGPLTNAALLFATFPPLASHIRGLSVMGGAIGGGFAAAPTGPTFTTAAGETKPRVGNFAPYAEFNVWCDPEAARSIFTNPILRPKTTVITLDITHQALATKQVQEMVLFGTSGDRSHPPELRKTYHDLLMFYAGTYAQVFNLTEGPPLHDPLAVAALLRDHPDNDVRVDFDDRGGERWEVDVTLAGEEVGRTKILPASAGTLVPRSLDLEKFWRTLDGCLARAEEHRKGEAG